VRGAAVCLEPSETRGFVIDEAEVTFWGQCPECVRNNHANAVASE
jgi:Fur family ferric uptake transcriptional regulator